MARKLDRLFQLVAIAALSAITLASCASSSPQPEPETVEVHISSLDAGKTIALDSSSILRVDLEGQPSTGFAWHVDALDSSILKTVGESVQAAPNVGGIDTQTFKVIGKAPGSTRLRFVNRRAWEAASPSSPSFEVNVVVNEPFAGAEPVGTSTQPLVLAGTAAAFPAHYNTCEAHGCTPIKDQGACGSCWAFATAGAFENRILQIDNVTRDLSEQYLVSCGFGSCSGAGNAFEAYINSVPSGEPAAGAVYEQDFPYVAADVPCNAPHPHHEKAITKGDQMRILWTPEELVAHLKAQIYYEGPVIVGACAGASFGAYTGGIYRGDDGCINHNIVLTGWDDNNGDGFWYGRNSWGTGFGEGGYIRIAYGAGSLDTFGYGVYGTAGTNARYRSGATIAAKDYDSQKGTSVDASGNVNGFDLADFLCYFGVDLTGVTSLDLKVASSQTGGLFMARADAYATYNEIARATMASTGGAYTTLNLPIAATPGVHSLCLWGETGTGIFNIQSITLKGPNSCTPQCAGKTCGSDGCGGSCGTCASGQTCNASQQCVTSSGSCASLKLSPSSATASSQESSATPAASAIDGNTGTRWSSAFSDPQWLSIDYGARRHFDHVVLRWEAAASASYDIQVSDDGVSFQTVKSNAAGAGGVEDITGLNANGRYLRIYSKARKTAYGVSLWEVEAYGDTNASCGSGSATCTDVALTRSAAVASSSENTATPASKAIDGNSGTRWSSAFSDPQWIYVDLGAARFVRRVILRWEAASSADYDIQVSNDGLTWMTKFTGKASGASTDTISGLGAVARYVRMYSRKRNTGYGNSLWEMEVYGDVSPSCTP